MPKVKFLYDLLSDATKTSEERVVFNFGIRLRHMKTENSHVTEFLALGKGWDLCQLSVCQKQKKHWNLSTGFTENEIRITFFIFISYY